MYTYPDLLNKCKQLYLGQDHAGIKVVEADQEKYLDNRYNLFHVLHQIDLSLIFVDTNFNVVGCSDKMVEFLNAGSAKELVGKNIDYFVAKRDNVNNIISNNLSVINNKKSCIFEEEGLFFSDTLTYITFKSPWYDNKNNVVGLFCCSVPLGRQSLAKTLPVISQLGFLNCSENFLLGEYSFTKREQECLYYLVRGKTAKIIARNLKLSPRTVEGYIEQIKIKANVCSKYELIEKFIDYI